jgi:hypothetical protein
MDCYKRLSPSREALFVMRECKVSALLLSRGSNQPPISVTGEQCRSNLSQVFSPYHTETF